MTWTSVALEDAAHKGWATPDGLLPVADERDLRQALHACARAPKSKRFAYVTHCARRAAEMGLPVSVLYDMCLTEEHKSVRGIIKNSLYKNLLHVRDGAGNFLCLGDFVEGTSMTDGSNFKGRIAEIDMSNGRVRIAYGKNDALDHISSSANLENFWHMAEDVRLPGAVTAAANSPVDRAWGRPATFSRIIMDKLRANIQAHLRELPADPTPWGDIQQFVDPQDGGPNEELRKCGKILEKLGRHVSVTVNGVLIEEGYAADLSVQKVLRSKLTSDFQRAATVQNEAIKKYGKLSPETISGEQKVNNVYSQAWLSASTGADKDTPFIEKFSNIFNATVSEIPQDSQGRIDKIDAALTARAQKWGQTSAQRVHALRKSQVTLQVLNALGIKFGDPEGAENPYIRLRPFGESEWTALRSKEPRMPDVPSVGDTVFTWSRPKKDPTAKKQVAEETPHLVKVKVTDVVQSQKGMDVSWEAVDPEVAKVKDKSGVAPSELYLAGKLSPVVEARMKAAHRVIPQKVMELIWTNSEYIQIGTDRARASRSETSLNLESSPSVNSVVHVEFHGLEFKAPWTMTLQWEKLVDLVYEGPVGQRRTKQGPPDVPNKYKIDRLAYIQRYPGFWGNEWGVFADFPDPYLGKLYFGEWSDVYAGGYCACGNYELLSGMAEACLAAAPPDTNIYTDEANVTLFAAREMVWESLQDWFLGFLVYITLGRALLSNNQNMIKIAQSQMLEESNRGELLAPNSLLPPDVSRVRSLGHMFNLRVFVYKNENTWTVVVEPNMVTAKDQRIHVNFKRRGDSAMFSSGAQYVDDVATEINSLADAIERIKSAGKGQLQYSVDARNAAVRTRTGVGAEQEPSQDYPVAPQLLFELKASQVEGAQ